MPESAEDASIREENYLQAYRQYVENNFHENQRRFGAFTHYSIPLVNIRGWFACC